MQPAFSGWGGVFGDQAVAAAMIDRVVHHATVLNLNGSQLPPTRTRGLGQPAQHPHHHRRHPDLDCAYRSLFDRRKCARIQPSADYRVPAPRNGPFDRVAGVVAGTNAAQPRSLRSCGCGRKGSLVVDDSMLQPECDLSQPPCDDDSRAWGRRRSLPDGISCDHRREGVTTRGALAFLPFRISLSGVDAYICL